MPRAALLLVVAGVVLSLPITHRTSGLQCGQAPRRDGAAVLYFHIFKAAGTTIREKLRQYAHACDLRWACLIDCERKVLGASLVNCKVKDEIHMPRDANRRSVLHLNRADVVGGHLHFGLVDAFPRARLVTLLRDPDSAVVSGIRYVHPTWKFDHVLYELRRRARGAPGSARNAVNYLAPPGRNASAAYAAAAANLRRFDVVGVVENWDASMRMLQAFLDPTHGWRGWHNDDRRNVHSQAFSTASVLRQLTSTDALCLAAYVSRERALYAAAVAAHRATCRALLGARDRGCRATID